MPVQLSTVALIVLVHPPFGMLLFVNKALTAIAVGGRVREGWMFIVMRLPWLPQTMGYGVE